MSIATYTLQTDGLAVTNTTVVIDGEWWSRSPVPIDTIGPNYQAMATVVSNTGATLSGVFDEWITIDEDVTWSADSANATTVLRVMIREKLSQEVVGSSLVTMDNVSLGPTSFVESVQEASPDYWWRLNESSGLVVADSGSGANPLIYPIDAGTSGYDTAPSSSFTGAGSRAKIIDDDSEIIQGLASVAGDINPLETIEFVWYPIDATPGVVLSKQLPGGAGAFWQLEIATTNRFRLRTFVGFGSNINLITDITSIVGQWNYISIVYDKTGSNTVSIKVDDVAGLSPSLGSNSIETGSTTTMAIGGQTAATDASNSRLDEVQFYSRILSDAERTRNYNFWATGSNP